MIERNGTSQLKWLSSHLVFENKKLKYTKPQFCSLFYIGVKFGLSY